MFNILIILTAVINLANCQESPDADSVAILSGLSTATLQCSLDFDRKFISENEAIAAAIEEMLAQREEAGETPKRRGQKNRDRDSVEEDAEDTEAPADDVPPRRELRSRGSGRTRPQRGDDNDVTRDDDSTREPKDATREPRERKSRDDSTGEPCDDDKTDVTREAEATEAPVDIPPRRNLRGGRTRPQRGVTRDEEADATRETEASEESDAALRSRDSGRTRPQRDVIRDDDSTREPKDATREPRDRSRDDSTREPCDEDKTGVTGEAEATQAPSDIPPRRNLRNRGNGRTRPQRDVSRGDNEDVTRESEESSEETLQSQRTRPERDVTRGDDNTREARDVTRETSNRDEDAAEAPLLGRLLRRDGDSTREPKDATREPCDDCGSGRRGRGDSDKSSDESAATDIPRRLLQEATETPDDSTKEPCDRTREPCVGDDCGRKGRKRGRKARKGEDSSDASDEVPELRRALGKDGRRGRRMGLGATISDGNVDIAGVTGEVVFGDVDEATESIPLTLTIGETTFQCNVEVRGSKAVSCIAVSENNFRVRVGCGLELEN